MSRTKRKVPADRYYRHIKTTQEIRTSEAAKVDGEPYRKSRSKTRLPNSWDDMKISASREIWKKRNR